MERKTIESDQNISNIFLILEHKENKKILADWLTKYHKVAVFDTFPSTNDVFDLCILDNKALSKFKEKVLSLKEKEKPVFLPVLLITSRQSIISGFKVDTPKLWNYVDEIIISPVEKSELKARVDVLLRTRMLSKELKAMKEDLEIKNKQLSELNNEKNRFVGMAAHDLRNPLSVIGGYSDVLLMTSENFSSEQIEFLNFIKSSSDFMYNLVNNLLDVSKIESGKLQLDLQLTDIVGLIKHNVTLNKPFAEKKQISLNFIHSVDNFEINIDGPKIEQVLNNLTSNAIKFSFPNTSIRIELRLENEYFFLSVQDQGQGIPTKELNKLFKPFQQISVKSTAGEKSTGLGLVIVKKVINGHKGEIWVESEVGKGTTFFIKLPKNIEIELES